jgi:copper chaperone CopZ
MTSSQTTYRVTGMTCGHCVSAVTEELTALDGVQDVAVHLDPEGVSTVTVTAAAALSDEQVAAALDEAGDYRLATGS